MMSNFFSSPSVFERLVLQTCENQGLFGKGLTLYHTITTFTDPERALENIMGKMLPAFSPSPTMFSTLSKAYIII